MQTSSCRQTLCPKVRREEEPPSLAFLLVGKTMFEGSACIERGEASTPEYPPGPPCPPDASGVRIGVVGTPPNLKRGWQEQSQRWGRRVDCISRKMFVGAAVHLAICLSLLRSWPAFWPPKPGCFWEITRVASCQVTIAKNFTREAKALRHQGGSSMVDFGS